MFSLKKELQPDLLRTYSIFINERFKNFHKPMGITVFNVLIIFQANCLYSNSSSLNVVGMLFEKLHSLIVL